MFRVLVLGGVALVGGTACGGSGSVSADAGDAGAEADAEFPFEGTSSASSSGGSSGSTSSGGSSGGGSGPDAGLVNDAASEAGPDGADSAACPPGDFRSGDGCFPGEAP
jgi:hypothetical protein